MIGFRHGLWSFVHGFAEVRKGRGEEEEGDTMGREGRGRVIIQCISYS